MSQKASAFYADLIATLGPEADLNQRVYLVTVSRVLPGNGAGHGYRDLAEVAREDVGRMVRDAFENPLTTGAGGRPRAGDAGSRVQFLAVAKEFHADGSPHFHIVVKLAHRMRFKPAKYTLQHRERMPSHWSSSHSQLWSAIRYIHKATPKKPTVDVDVWSWCEDGSSPDLTELSREPFTAVAWRKAREAR